MTAWRPGITSMNASKPELIIAFVVVCTALLVSNFLFWGAIYWLFSRLFL